ncbi:MAG: peptidase [Myxococcales bacterium]|nr:peptidase [Myxococcales bacterium]
MNLSPHDIRWIVIRVFVLIGSVAFHEFGHAIMAYKLGDDTPRRQGRVTLNPLAHADPIGTFLLPIAGSVYNAASGSGVGGFGWGKPVEWNPTKINRKWRMATARILVAIAGPSMNIVLALLCALVNVILLSQNVVSLESDVTQILFFAVTTNFVLCFFNLLPVPPLDGGHVAESFMPYRHRATFESYARFGPFIVMGFVMIPQFAQVFRIPAYWCAEHLYKALLSLFGM